MMQGTYNIGQAALAVLVAIAASYTALDLANRTNEAHSRLYAAVWLAAAAFAMGGGIWSMHFIAMLAYSMPGMPASYDPAVTALSFGLAVAFTAAAFAVVRWSGSWIALIFSGVLMGVGIAGMHYMGMAAMRMPGELTYDPAWVWASVGIAVGASVSALWLAFRHSGILLKSVAPIAMGLAISGMHFAGMQGATFAAETMGAHTHAAGGVDQLSLALAVAVLTLFILFLASIAAVFDRRFAQLANGKAEALRRSEEQFRALYRHTPLPLNAINSEGQLEEVSDTWLVLLGYERDEVLGRRLANFMTESSAERRRNIDWPQLLTHKGPMAREYEMLTRSGAVLSVVSTSQVERDQDGDFIRAIGGLIDLTARKQAEEALIQAQKMEAIGQLTGGVAHDFNNLLAVISGSLELMVKRLPSDPKLERMAGAAQEATRRAASLTQRMLAFARKQTLETTAVDVAGLISGLHDMLQRSIGPEVFVEVHSLPQLPDALVDPHQLELALLNLVLNARDAMPEGGTIRINVSEVKVSAGELADLTAGVYVRLAVADSGAGMSEEVLKRAREPFFTTKEVGKGTGLGLSMVYGFAAQSGGALILKSRLGEGTTAEIWLPVSETLSNVHNDAPAHDGKGTRPLNILAVDDNALVLMSTVETLQDLGHYVIEAASGQEALALLGGHPEVQLIVTDQAMPGMTGIELIEAAKAQSRTIKAIIVTGHADFSVKRPDVPVLFKPFTQAQLAQSISKQMRSPARLQGA